MCDLNFGMGKDKKNVDLEITIQIRDRNGNPTGKTKSFDGNHRDVSDWYTRQSPKKKKRKRRKKEDKK